MQANSNQRPPPPSNVPNIPRSDTPTSSLGATTSQPPLHKRRELTQEGNPVITIGFFQPKEQREEFGCFGNMVNSITSRWTMIQEGHNFSHVELRFSTGETTSVTQNSPVHYKERLLSNPNYTHFWKMTVTQAQEQEMMDMAKDYCNRQVAFNTRGMWWNFIPLLKCMPVQRDGRAVFCSEYVVMLLQRAGIMHGIKPALTSPNELYMYLQQDPCVYRGINTVVFNAMGGTKRPISLHALSAPSLTAATTTTTGPKQYSNKYN